MYLLRHMAHSHLESVRAVLEEAVVEDVEDVAATGNALEEMAVFEVFEEEAADEELAVVVLEEFFDSATDLT